MDKFWISYILLTLFMFVTAIFRDDVEFHFSFGIVTGPILFLIATIAWSINMALWMLKDRKKKQVINDG